MQTTPAAASATSAPRKRSRAVKPKPDAATPGVTVADDRDARIRKAAYAFFLQRQPGDANPLEDWLKAEALVDQPAPGGAQAEAAAGAGH